MSDFTGSALNGIVQGMRLHDQDQRVEEQHDWKKDKHQWEGETHQALNLRRDLENQVLQQGINDDHEYRTALKVNPGTMKAGQENNAYDDAKTEREREQDMALMARGFFQFENSGDPNFLTGAMGQTFLGKGKSYTPQWDRNSNTFSIINRDGKAILSAQGKTQEEMMDRLQDMLIMGLSNPANYLKARSARRQALNLENVKADNERNKIRWNRDAGIALEGVKGLNKRKAIELEHGLKEQDKDDIILPTSDGRGERLTLKEARQQLTDISKYLKDKSGDQSLVATFAAMQSGQLSPEEVFSSNDGEMLIERIEQIASSNADSRARGYAQRFLAIVDEMYGDSPSTPKANYEPALNPAIAGMRGNSQPPSPIKESYNPQAGRHSAQSWRDY
ncbi:hypothetical protein [Maridesulfovibrio sp.]|uniref:hypothetical protein n=1 Tax=Maridesulfovibrio sp. TaxID=2795000 RepID=UPI0029CA64DD|nr:hypothetical protein [Maridesulfovibrio sp.]